MFETLVIRRRYQRIAEKIIEEISSGRMVVGSRLPPERELALQFGVSRPTVREALLALEIMGFVDIRVGSGVSVRSRTGSQNSDFVSEPGPFEMIEARRIMEGEISAIAATIITDQKILELEKCIEDTLVENSNNYKSFEADWRFHLTLAEATENSALLNFVDYFWQQRAQAPMWERLYGRVSPFDIRDSAVNEHRAIVAALRARSPGAARSAMHQHIDRVARTLLDSWNALTPEERSDYNRSGNGAVHRISTIVDLRRETDITVSEDV